MPWTLVRPMAAPRNPEPAEPALSADFESRIRGERVVWTLVRSTHSLSGDIGEPAVDYGENRFTANQRLSGVIPWTLVCQF
jgi:hypothetical protein